METTNISNLKNRLSEYLRKVRSGETVLVLDRNRLIARIEPVGGSAADERIARLEAQGVIRRGTEPLPDDFFAVPRPRFERSMLKALLEERKESR